MAIIVQRKGERAEIVSEIRFPDEAELQRYVYENPQVLPIPDIKEDVQFTVLDKETPVRTGYIDILGVDSEGDPLTKSDGRPRPHRTELLLYNCRRWVILVARWQG